MPQLVFFDELSTPQRVTEVTGSSVDEGPFLREGRTDFVVAQDLSHLAVVPRRYWKHENGAIVEYTPAEKATQDTAEALEAAAEAVVEEANTRFQAKDNFEGFLASSLFFRAFADILKDEINILRAAVPGGLPPRTLKQLRNALRNRIDSGDVDA